MRLKATPEIVFLAQKLRMKMSGVKAAKMLRISPTTLYRISSFPKQRMNKEVCEKAWRANKKGIAWTEMPDYLGVSISYTAITTYCYNNKPT